MKATDKLLIAIVLGVVILIGVAFAIAFTQPKPEYRTGDDPEAVTYNYLLAMQQNDYERAYTYLSPTISGYPRSMEKFTEDVNDHSYYFGSYSNQTESFEILSSDVKNGKADVKVRRTAFRQGDLFDSGESTSTLTVSLVQSNKDNQWGITHSNVYWAYCWNQSGGCH